MDSLLVVTYTNGRVHFDSHDLASIKRGGSYQSFSVVAVGAELSRHGTGWLPGLEGSVATRSSIHMALPPSVSLSRRLILHKRSRLVPRCTGRP